MQARRSRPSKRGKPPNKADEPRGEYAQIPGNEVDRRTPTTQNFAFLRDFAEGHVRPGGVGLFDLARYVRGARASGSAGCHLPSMLVGSMVCQSTFLLGR